ncbi:SRPBCC domain-containing protein [Streptomyces sp. NPDC091292]|uniref:SRPBCC family protein n=1 Tax=Streptomyces sp. NPDC091292 TaxID=3365991 RepID=UPI003815CE2F
MSKEFEIVRELEVDATPQQVWDAITTGTAGWLWPSEFEPREGGATAGGGVVTAWDPPHRFTTRVESDDMPGQSLNLLDQTVEPRDDGKRAWVRYVHSGILTDDWDNQYDGATKHTTFYLHTLTQYLTHFTGRPAAYTAVNGPAASTAPDAFVTVARALGLFDDAGEGTRLRVQGPDGRVLDAVVDYRDPYFIGLRTDDAMYRFFGRNHWGAPVGVAVHDFGPSALGGEARESGSGWQGWLEKVFA